MTLLEKLHLVRELWNHSGLVMTLLILAVIGGLLYFVRFLVTVVRTLFKGPDP